MKITLLIICFLAVINSQMSLQEIDRTEFGRTLLDTIALQLMSQDVEEGALTGPVKVIYDMLLELRDQLNGEQETDNQGLDGLCLSCTTTLNTYNDKIDVLTAQMAVDAQETQELLENMGYLATNNNNAVRAVQAADVLLGNLLDEYNSDILLLQSDIDGAQNVYNALVAGRRIIAENLVSSEAMMLLQTNAFTTVTATLRNTKSKLKGYASVGAELMQLATEQEIISDQDLVGSILQAFDDLMQDLRDEILGLEQRKTSRTVSYNDAKAPLTRQRTDAKVQEGIASTQLNQAKLRKAALAQKLTNDTQDLEAWNTFVTDETLRCTAEEGAFNTRMTDRTEQLRILEEVILLFETDFVEMNEYINSRVNLDENEPEPVAVAGI